jgi:predicted nucleic-acid-binding Zn-ribbon protein
LGEKMSDVKLPKFNAESTCPKCGHDDVSVRYRGPIDDDVLWYDRKYRPVGKWPEHEYLHRTCKSCAYDWPEAAAGKAAP